MVESGEINCAFSILCKQAYPKSAASIKNRCFYKQIHLTKRECFNKQRCKQIQITNLKECCTKMKFRKTGREKNLKKPNGNSISHILKKHGTPHD